MKQETADRIEAQRKSMLKASYLTTAEHQQANNPKIKPLIEARNKAQADTITYQECLEDARKEYSKATQELGKALLEFIPAGIFDVPVAVTEPGK